ncbi:MAG: hypothetical protein ACE5FV_12245 [Woeseia sp.]
MPETDFDGLRDRLLRSGVSPRHVVRAVSELSDHLEDLECEAAGHGLDGAAARSQASERIGAIESITQQYLSRPELKCWLFRHPQIARLILPLAYLVMLPAVPIYAGVSNAPSIAKWCACLLLSAFITATMLLVMQLTITIT